MEHLFNIEEKKRVLIKFKEKMASFGGERNEGSGFTKERNDLIKSVITCILANPNKWDEMCQMNIEWIGDEFILKLKDYCSGNNNLTDNDCIDGIFSSCFRFLFEFYLSTPEELSHELEKSIDYCINNLDSFNSRLKRSVGFAIKKMPIAIFKEAANGQNIEAFKNFSARIEEAENLKRTWDEELDSRQKRVSELQESLNKHEDAFNFVGLYHGFKELSDDKRKEKKWTQVWLVIVGMLIIIPFILEIYYILDNFFWNLGAAQEGNAEISSARSIGDARNGLLLLVLPMVPLMAISVYYFRVLLFSYRSTKSQLLQIELRKTLCKFVQKYMEYAKDLKGDDKESFAKFESIIFSGIVTDGEKLPSTYDGIEQLAKLFKTLKGSGT